MATYTENFGLHQWVPEDDFLRSDFNADFAKIDQALAAAATEADLTELRTRVNGKCELLTGSFLGNGAETRSINIGDRPLALAICSEQNMFATVLMRGGDPMGPCLSQPRGSPPAPAEMCPRTSAAWGISSSRWYKRSPAPSGAGLLACGFLPCAD